jgi:hypothetical protein
MAAHVNNNQHNNQPRKYQVLFREGEEMTAAEGLFKEGMTRSCRISPTILPAVIFSLRSKPKFAKNSIDDLEGGATPC